MMIVFSNYFTTVFSCVVKTKWNIHPSPAWNNRII